MKVITWNVRGGNRHVMELIAQALRHSPDILCLQEVPEHALMKLRERSSYYIYVSEDFKGKHTWGNRYTVILTKKRPIRVRKIPYLAEHKRALWERFIYETIMKAHECRTALAIDVLSGTHKTVRFVSTRLPATIGTHERLRLFTRIVQRLDTTAINIICGDLNVVDGRFLNIISGWTRSFRLTDYFINERRAFEKLLGHFDMVNIFRGVATWGFGLPFFQFDHIIVPRGIKVRYAKVSTRRFGSDHRMLLADLEV